MSSDLQFPHAAIDLPSPPTWAQRFRSDDLDEVAEFISGFLDQRARVTHGAGEVRFDQSTLAGASLQVAWMRSNLGMTVRGATREPVLHLATPAGTEYRFGRRRWTAERGSVTFVPPGWEHTRIRAPGRVLALSINLRRLADEVEARFPGRRGDLMLRARSISLPDAEHARMMAAVEDFMLATEPGAAPSVLAGAEARVIGALAGLLLEESAASRGQEVATSRLVNLEAWIEAHLEEPISIGRLCSVAAVGERALQKAFESRRGMSPMRYVAERRLAAARRLLSRPDRRDDVTQIALRLGFAHISRFAAVYRQAFGEPPSATLRRAMR
jgi:AraC-like DNA-binding protein